MTSMCFGILHIAQLAHSGSVWLGCSSIFSRLSLYTSNSCQRQQNMSQYPMWWWKAIDNSCSLLKNRVSPSSSSLRALRLVLLLPHLALWGLPLLLGQDGFLYPFQVLNILLCGSYFNWKWRYRWVLKNALTQLCQYSNLHVCVSCSCLPLWVCIWKCKEPFVFGSTLYS